MLRKRNFKFLLHSNAKIYMNEINKSDKNRYCVAALKKYYFEQKFQTIKYLWNSGSCIYIGLIECNCNVRFRQQFIESIS